MFCPKCGSDNPAGAGFCHTCGNKLKQIQKKELMGVKEKTGQGGKRKWVKRPALSVRSSILLAEGVLFVVLAAIFIQIGSSRFSAEGTAKEFARAYLSGNWDAVYSYFDLEPGKYLDREDFRRAMEGNAPGNVTNYEVVVEQGTSDIIATTKINYQLTGEPLPEQLVLTLNKTKQKNRFFFDSWKVNPNAFLKENCRIYVPKGSIVELNEEKLTDSDRDLEESDDQCDAYRFPKLFSGIYQIQVKKEPMEDVEASVYAESGLMFQVDHMQLPEEDQKELVTNAAAMLKATYEAALANASFQTLKAKFVEDPDIQNTAEESYMCLVNALYLEDQTGIEKIDFSEIGGSVSVHMEDSGIYANVILQYQYEVDYTYTSWWDDEKQQGYYDSSQTSEYRYRYEGGTWKLEEADFDQIYYGS